MRVGYARVSTQDQNPDLQLDALNAAGCEEIFHEKMSGRIRARPELDACLRALRKGDTLVVWRLDRLGAWAVESTDATICHADDLPPVRP